MPTNQNLIHACDRALAGITEVKANAVKLMQLENEIKRAEQTLAGLQAQAAQIKPLITRTEELDQRIRAKRSELADLEAVIAKKHADHGAVENALRDLRKKISGDPQHA